MLETFSVLNICSAKQKVMDVRFLESLIFVIEEGSIAGAARAQNLTATAVSQRMRVLESELDIQLLSRNAHSVRPTQACIDILPRMHKLIREAQAIKDDINPTELSGTLKLGVISTALIDFVPNIFRYISREAPKVDINIVPGTSQTLYDLLIKEKIDAAILVRSADMLPKFILSQTLAKQELIFIGADNSKKSIKQLLTSNKLILYDRKSRGGEIAWKWIKDQKLDVEILCELDPLETIATLVEERLGVAVIPNCQNILRHHKDLKIKSLKQTKADSREIAMVWNHNCAPKSIMDLLKKAVQKD